MYFNYLVKIVKYENNLVDLEFRFRMIKKLFLDNLVYVCVFELLQLVLKEVDYIKYMNIYIIVLVFQEKFLIFLYIENFSSGL